MIDLEKLAKATAQLKASKAKQERKARPTTARHVVEFWLERASIREFEGGVSRKEAEDGADLEAGVRFIIYEVC